MFDLFSVPNLWEPMVLVYLFWFFIFAFVGLYQSWFALSRFDEISSLFKATFVGIFILFFLIFMEDSSSGISSGQRGLILLYWGILFIYTSAGRASLRLIQRYLLIKGVGRKNALIVGTGKLAAEISSEISEHRGLGIDIVGFIDILEYSDGIKSFLVSPVLGLQSDIEQIISDYQIKEVIFAVENHQNTLVVEIISQCENHDISLKSVPNLFEILSGQARTSQLYAVPLIDINPQLMPAWEQKVKRLMDVTIAALMLITASPLIIAAAIAIKLNSRGPVFYRQERCGIHGSPFKIVKFRSMYIDAETKTGPVWSRKNDPRVTSVGRFIRKVRIDEIPQMWNVLRGEMSLIGPRPERPFFVEKLSKEIPYYKRRLKVRPGITGWAQVKHKYDETVEDVKEKVKFDLFYIENMSIRMDLKILLRTVLVVLFGKGHYN